MKSVLRTRKVVEIRSIEPNLHQLLWQSRLHLEELLLILVGEETAFIAIINHQEKENSSNVVTGMIKVFAFDVYVLLDLGDILSFLTSYVANKFDILLEKLCEPLFLQLFESLF